MMNLIVSESLCLEEVSLINQAMQSREIKCLIRIHTGVLSLGSSLVSRSGHTLRTYP